MFAVTVLPEVAIEIVLPLESILSAAKLVFQVLPVVQVPDCVTACVAGKFETLTVLPETFKKSVEKPRFQVLPALHVPP